MMSTTDKDALARRIAEGDYVIDTHAVAEAMLRRGGLSSLVLISPQAGDGTPVRAEQDDPAADAGIA
jgi:hypothetical protein